MSKTLKFSFIAIISGLISGLIASLLLIGILVTLTYNNSAKVSAWLGLNQSVEVDESAPKYTGATGTQEAQVIEAVNQASPAVVSIVITKDVPVIESYYEQGYNDPFDQFFGLNSPQQKFRQNGTEEQEVGGGSGFIVSEDGYIITNRHVISDKEADYTVFMIDGEKYEAEIVATDPINDIAVLKINATGLSYLEFGDSDRVQVGQSVIAIGYALSEFTNSVSVGVISGLSRSIEAGDGFGKSEQLDNVIQTDAAVNPGNSGGPLLNLQGQVIGVNVAVAYGSENISFALPANLVSNVVNSVKEHGKIVRPYMGVRYVMITESLKEKNNLTVDYGALISRGETIEDLAVIPGSPADKAGLLENDIILEINGTKIDKNSSLISIISQKKVGDTVKLKILRKGEEQEVELVLEERPSDN